MILGIDLGTSNSMAAVYKEGEVVFIKSQTGSAQIPSIVSMDENGDFYTGDAAKGRKISHPESTVEKFKGSMGTKTLFSMGNRKFKAEQLSGILLKSIKEDAESFLGEEVTEAIICVPAFFNTPQRKAVIRAGELAGFQVKKIVNEPTAAAFAYGIKNMEKEENAEKDKNIETGTKAMMVLDLGGGTFDISIMEVTKNIMEVVSICGDNHLGGEDFTKRLIELFFQENAIQGNLTLEEERILWEQAKQAKYQITREGRGEMRCILQHTEYQYSITEEEYEKACLDLLEKIRKLIIQAVKESPYMADELDEVLLVGGGTKLSIVKKMVEKMVGRDLDYKIDPDKAVSMGAAMHGALLEKDKNIKDLIVTDICPYYIGVYVWDYSGQYDVNVGFSVIIPKNTTIPAKRSVTHYDRPGSVLNEIIQSEDEYGINSTSLGEIHYVRPEVGKRSVGVEKIITYDANGIIHVEYYIEDNNMRYQLLIRNDNCELTEEEAKKEIEELQYKKIHAEYKDKDRMLIERAEQFYAEFLGEEREKINQGIIAFESALREGKATYINEKREYLVKLLDVYDQGGEIW